MIPSAGQPASSGDAARNISAGRPRSVYIAGAGTLGIALLVLSLSMLFGASLVGYLVFRSGFSIPVSVHLPPGLWLSTFVLLASSVTIHFAIQGVRKDRQRQLQTALVLTLALGLVFLVIQFFNWLALYGALGRAEHALAALRYPLLSRVGGLRRVNAAVVERNDLLVLFYTFTVLHALHVIGGLIPLSVVNVKAFRGAYHRNYYPGVRYCTIYWHFLDIVWLFIFITLLATF